MLDPQVRHLYLSALRPPDGYNLDRAIATTFTLDLMSLLMAPMSMVLAQERDAGSLLADPIAVLESLRQTTDKLAIFCQAGRISVPKVDSQLYSYLEPVVVEVDAPGGGVFHPKVWIIRFVAQDGPVIYRLLCLSRNLTFDRSWDTILTLEGELNEERTYGYSLNRPLKDFVSALPNLALRQFLPASVQTHIDTIAAEIARVQFAPPSEFEEIVAFSPSGIPGYKRRRPISDHSRLLVMSPFLTDNWLSALSDYGYNNVLISRQASIDGLRDVIWQQLEANQTQVYVMQEVAERAEDEEPLEDDPGPPTIDDLSGLHAKLFIAESGWWATVLTGSANATGPGFSGANVEFMVELSGKRSQIGIERFLGSENEEQSLRNMLQPYHRPDTASESNSIDQDLERALNEARQSLIDANLSLTVSFEQADTFTLILETEQPAALRLEQENIVDQIAALCHPISLNRSYAKETSPLFSGETVVFPELSLVALTSFLAFEITAKLQDRQATIRFVLNVPTVGIPQERDKHILRSIISDRSRFIRYLLLLLADDDEIGIQNSLLSSNGDINSGMGAPSGIGLPLLEELVRAASRQPEKITRIARLVDDLRQSGEAEMLLPDGFDQIWEAFELFQEGETEMSNQA